MTAIPGMKPADYMQRDRWGRPLVTPVGGGKPVPYTRVSTLAKALDDTNALMDWKCRQTAIGLSRRADLMSLVPVHAADRRALNGVVKDALAAAGSDVSANVGTAIHGFTEHVDHGGALDDVPEQYRPHVAAYRDALAAAGIVAVPQLIERFIVNDDMQVAGTFDRGLLLPDGRFVIGDIKTGSAAPRYSLATAMQVALYARGSFYDPETGERSELPANLDRNVGVLIHVPQDRPGVCELHELDLEAGHMAAYLALDIRAYRKRQLARPWAVTA